MKLTVVDQIRLYRTPDGRIWGSGWGGYEQFQRYLATFDSVRILCRIFPVEAPQPAFVPCDGPGVSFACAPLFSGPWQYAWNKMQSGSRLADLYDPSSAYLLRVPSQVSFDVADHLRARRHPFGLIVVADPRGEFAPGATRSVLRPILRYRFSARLRMLCREAAIVGYVTRRALQQEYPSRDDRRVDGASDALLPPSWFVDAPRDYSVLPATISMVSVGSLANMCKGVDTLIEAFVILAGQKINATVVHAGDGRHRGELVDLARRRGVSSAVRLPGAVSHTEAVKDLLDHSDIYLMPSRTEGMSRSLLEAMARGLPCIGSNVGGIPEILSSEDLVSADDPRALATKIIEVAGSSERLSAMSKRNLDTALEFSAERLRPASTRLLSGLEAATREMHR